MNLCRRKGLFFSADLGKIIRTKKKELEVEKIALAEKAFEDLFNKNKDELAKVRCNTIEKFKKGLEIVGYGDELQEVPSDVGGAYMVGRLVEKYNAIRLAVNAAVEDEGNLTAILRNLMI